MGKPLIQQRRGKGSSTFRAHTFKSKGDVKTPTGELTGVVVDLITSPFHSAPLSKVKYDNGTTGLLLAPHGVLVGQTITVGKGDIELGNTLTLEDIPEGASVFNVEGVPGDGGKFARGSGAVCRVLSKQPGKVVVMLPSKKKKIFNPNCRATLGVVAGGGRLEKPILRAGTKYHKMKAKNKFWPKVSGAAMNAVAHPFGGKRSGRKGRPTVTPKNAPAGRKVGMLRARKTGRARGTRVRKN
ncbi:MAG: 50S ribosomal protein L2 [Candidatus Woesearchaeota archaeon]|nr:50S ribosomal protein L2 [Candidatus Woesearchaeota archaeon]